MSGKTHWSHHCSSSPSREDPMKRVYMREPGSGKFLPIGWYCPHCNATEFINQCRTCGKIEPNPDREGFRKTGICYRCEEHSEKMAKEHVPLTTFTDPAADERARDQEDDDEDPCTGCLSWEICPGTLNDKWCKTHRKYPEEKDRQCIHPPADIPASMLELVRPLVSKTELAGLKNASVVVKCPGPSPEPKKFGVAICRSRKCPELKRDENPYGPQGERCMVFNNPPGNFPCCIKDPAIPAKDFLHTAAWSLLAPYEVKMDKKRPGPRNCPATCPYKLQDGTRWKCAFTGDVLGAGLSSICYCHVLDSSDQTTQIEELKIGIEERRAKPDSICAWKCPDGIDRDKFNDDACPVCKVKYNEIKVCPLWRIPGELLKTECIHDAAAPAPGKHGSLRLRSRLSSTG